jgi:predicted secreted protein
MVTGPLAARGILACGLGLIGLAGPAPAVLCAADATAPAPTTAPTPEQQRLEQQLAEVRGEVERLEREAYQSNPKLKQMEDWKRAIEAEQAKGQRRNELTLAWLQDQEGRNPAVRRVYHRLTSRWCACMEIEYLKDPDKAELLKICLLNEHGSDSPAYLRRAYRELGDADLSTPEKFWEAYAATYPVFEHGARASLEADVKASGFPQFVLDQAKRDGEATLERRVIEAYLVRRTPAPLRDARVKAHMLEIDLRNQQLQKLNKPPAP